MVKFSPEQLLAIKDRDRSILLAANAGSGKTAIMVERFVEAVLKDGVAVDATLALTFTEKAAAEFKERLRHRFTDLGAHDEARATDSSWIGTVHGFCLSVLRSQPLSTGLDPRFKVLEDHDTRRIANRAFESALELWVQRWGGEAVDIMVSYGTLRAMVLNAYDSLRSIGQTNPEIVVPPQPSEPPRQQRLALARARDEVAALLEDAGDGKRVTDARIALEACRELLESGEETPLPSRFAQLKLCNGAKILEDPACEQYRTAYDAFKQASVDFHAYSVIPFIADLLALFGEKYTELKRARAGLDFEDLQLLVRDLFKNDDKVRQTWSERFSLIMIDEFQDTNRLQLDILEALEADNLFVVGDEFQSIYGFRHADVKLFQERRAALGAQATLKLRTNYRSDEAVLDAINHAFIPLFSDNFEPLISGRQSEAEGRLFDVDHFGAQAATPVELLITDSEGWGDVESELGLGELTAQPSRRAEARLLAHRIRREVDEGRRPQDIVILVRATASLRLFEQALEEQGLPTYVVGGRGYWSHEQVRDGLAYLLAFANPLDETALLGVLSSPFCGVGTDALIQLGERGRANGNGIWEELQIGVSSHWGTLSDQERLLAFTKFFAKERELSERLPIDQLLERAVTTTEYDLKTLSRPGGERRLANMRKLMRLAREYEYNEGPDLQGFLTYAASQDLLEAHEGEAPLESEGLQAIRLMTIHRAKGLEFPVVCVADLGRAGNGRNGDLLIGRDASVGLKLRLLGVDEVATALAYDRLKGESSAADAEEERRLFYVAATRAGEQLILSGTQDQTRKPRVNGPPIDWIAPAFRDRTTTVLSTPEAIGEVLTQDALSPTPRLSQSQEKATLTRESHHSFPHHQHVARKSQRLSYSTLQSYTKCPYRFYLQRRLRLPSEPFPRELLVDPLPVEVERNLSAMQLGTLVHYLLSRLDFRNATPPSEAELLALALNLQLPEPTATDAGEITLLLSSFTHSQLFERIRAAQRVQREVQFAFALDPGGEGSLVSGIVDLVVFEEKDRALVVDYKSDPIEPGVSLAEVVLRDYKIQQTVYALAALAMGVNEVEVAYCYLRAADQPVTSRFTRSDIPALTGELVATGAGLLAERYPVASNPHLELCGSCPGRKSLCSWDGNATLRPLAQGKA